MAAAEAVRNAQTPDERWEALLRLGHELFTKPGVTTDYIVKIYHELFKPSKMSLVRAFFDYRPHEFVKAMEGIAVTDTEVNDAIVDLLHSIDTETDAAVKRELVDTARPWLKSLFNPSIRRRPKLSSTSKRIFQREYADINLNGANGVNGLNVSLPSSATRLRGLTRHRASRLRGEDLVKTCAKATNIVGESWTSIPDQFRYGPVKKFCFDLRELVKTATIAFEQGQWPKWTYLQIRITVPELKEIVEALHTKRMPHSPLLPTIVFGLDHGYIPMSPKVINNRMKFREGIHNYLAMMHREWNESEGNFH